MDDTNDKKIDGEEAEKDSDVTIDDTDETLEYDNETVSADKIKKLKKDLAQVRAEKMQYLTDLQKAKADFINMRKRDEEGNKDFVKYAKENVILDIIPVLDSFDMAFSNKEAWNKVSSEWRTGVEYIYNQLLGVLANHGVTTFNPLGVDFSPQIHEAVEMVPVTDMKDDHKVIVVIQKGYKMGEKIIRPAKVKVGQIK